ncbi:hypothetical protein AAE478_000364 [Parahypoxylon ruwenzoriense]
MASADNSHGSEPYSTLEVINLEETHPQDLGNSHKEVVAYPESEYPQPVVWAVTQKEAVGDTEANAAQGVNDEVPKQAKILGLSKRDFYIVLTIVILVVIGAIAGGVAGGLTGRRNQSNESNQTPEPDSNANINVLSNSKLTASNWTDSDGNQHRSVFFQDPYNNIIARQWDSQNNTWATRNISQLMQSSTSGPIKPFPGTALASTTADSPAPNRLYEVHLFFSESGDESSSTVSRLSSRDPRSDPNFWVYLNYEFQTWNNTQLSATWQRCWRDDCIGYYTLAYQGPEGAIRVANASDWNDTRAVVRTNAVSAGASLALIPTYNRARRDGLILATQRRPNSMGKTTFVNNWNWREDDGTIMGDLDPLETREFAATKLNNWNETLFVALTTDGETRATRWDGTESSSVPEINFAQGESTNFSAIAMTLDAMFYGIADDQVWEYSVDTSDPSTFTLAGKIYP